MEVVRQSGQTTDDIAGTDITGLLSAQRDLYRHLLWLTEKQRSLITADDPERLLTLLAERQQHIDKLGAIGLRLRPYQANWRQIRERLGREDGARVDGLVDEINTLLADIVKTDEADTALLSARKGETGQAIGKVQTGRRVGRAYAAASEQHQPGMDWSQT